MSAAKYAPEWETESQRSVALGYEPPGDSWVRCLEHGYPTPLARWHRHEEYELHLIVETSGRAFIRDYVGSFSAGNVFLTGPGVPHNWVSDRLPLHGTPLRDLVMQFSGGPVCRARKIYPELRELAQMLERARAGVEFVGVGRSRRACVSPHPPGAGTGPVGRVPQAARRACRLGGLSGALERSCAERETRGGASSHIKGAGASCRTLC